MDGPSWITLLKLRSWGLPMSLIWIVLLKYELGAPKKHKHLMIDRVLQHIA